MTNSTPTTIKKYANRRLYNTASSAYVTLADLAKMVKGGEDFVVYDAKTNEDITRSVLTQIIFEQEGIEGQSLLPTTFLRQLIRFYGDSMQALLPSYLELSIDRFSGERQAMREAASRMFGPEAFSAGSFAALQELTKKNLAAFNQALTMFSPFAGATPATESRLAKKANSEDDIDRTSQSAFRHAEAPRIAGQEELRRFRTGPCARGARQTPRQDPPLPCRPLPELPGSSARRNGLAASSAATVVGKVGRPFARSLATSSIRSFRTGLPGSTVTANRPFASVYSCPQ